MLHVSRPAVRAARVEAGGGRVEAGGAARVEAGGRAARVEAGGARTFWWPCDEASSGA